MNPPRPTDRLIYKAAERDAGREVQYLLRERLGMPSGMIKTLKYNNGILLDGAAARGNVPVRAGQTVTALLNCKCVRPEIAPEPHPLRILYEDDAFLVVDKPAGTVVHPTCRHQSGTLSNYVLHYWQQKGIFTDIHLVGRLDKDTTGIVILARNGYVQEALRRQGEAGILKKYYVAAVSPAPQKESGVIDAPVVRDYDSIIKRKIAEVPGAGSRAVTHYRVIQAFETYALVTFLLETGRTHQIRLHCSYAGFPILGDTLYGHADGDGLAHQLLHAYRIELIHPITREPVRFTADPPPEWGRYAPQTPL